MTQTRKTETRYIIILNTDGTIFAQDQDSLDNIRGILDRVNIPYYYCDSLPDKPVVISLLAA